MIAANELRIGNLVRYGMGNIQITMVDKFIALSVNGNGDFNPIPLTSELLKKCGFVDNNDNPMVTVLTKQVMPKTRRGAIMEFYAMSKDDKTFDVWYCVNNTTCSSMINSLHQLQNLYYALTKTELQITL